MIARLHRAWQRRAAKWFGRRIINIRPAVPTVSFTFDDFPDSAVSVGGAILEEAGARGTYYASLGLAGQTIETGLMFSVERIEELVTRGHELGCHTYNHFPAWETPTREFEASVVRNDNALRALIKNQIFRTHSYPISYPRPPTKRLMSTRFAACRGGGQSFNCGKADANYLKSFFIEQSREDLAGIKAMIDASVSQSGWLIFSTHDVSDRPTHYGCTPTQLNEIVRHSIAAGAEIRPVSQALAASILPAE